MKTLLSDLNKFLLSLKTSDYAQLVFENFDLISNKVADPVEGISGAKDPVLPMTISIADSANNRIQFVLLINPSNINHGKSATVNMEYTRKGYITQLWGPKQDLLTGTGTTAAFMITGEGLTTLNIRSSLAYHNFLSLFYVYRNNGYELVDPTALSTVMTRVVNVVHGIEIFYDGQIYMGHFNNFTIEENAERPFVFNYNFDFVISSLSSEYNEVRGHFIPIGEKIASTNLLAGIKRRGRTIVKSALQQQLPEFQVSQEKGKVYSLSLGPFRFIQIGSDLAARNNNPGNLRYAKQPGAIPGYGGFARFPTAESGFNALVEQIKLDARRGDSVTTFLQGTYNPKTKQYEGGYAPPSENDTDSYIKFVCQQAGVTPDTPISKIDPYLLAKIICKRESNTILQ